MYDILKRKYLILSKDAVKCLTERLEDKSGVVPSTPSRY